MRLALTALAAAMLTPPAQADGNPWGLGASLSVAHDSNVLRTPDAQAQGDTIATVGIQGQLDENFGRHRLQLNASVARNRYSNRSDLDYGAYNISGQLDLEPGDRLFGKLSLNSSQVAFNYDPSNGSTRTAQNLERNHLVALRLRQGVVTRWTLEGGVELQRRDESDAVFDYRQLQRQALDLGARYQHTPDLSVGGLVRHATGSYPNQGASGDDFRRTDLEAYASWQFSGASLLDLRLTASDESHDLASVRSSTRWTGAARWRWQPTGKLSFSTRLARDSDTGSRDQTLLGNALQSNDARQRTNLDLSGVWQASGKLRLEAQWSVSRRNLDASLQALGSQSGSDISRQARLALVYQATRNLEAGCNVTHDSRSVSGNTQGLSYAYDATVFACYAQAWLR